MRRSRAVMVLGALVSVLAWTAPAEAGSGRDIDPFRGLGAWIDVFDYLAPFQQTPGPVPVTADTIDDLAALGVETIYLQAAIDDPREKGLIVDRARVGAILRRAHDNDMKVVAWYYPQLADPERDRERLEAIVDFESRGEEFDAIGLDIESRLVPDVEIRNDRLVRLTRQISNAAGDRPVAAIVYPAVQLEVVNLTLWPDFPYKRLARHVDAWFPMVYWTYRDGTYRNAFNYTEESVRRLRDNLGDRRAPVHPIGGLAGLSSPSDYDSFVAAAKDVDAIGWSVYDADTTATTAWRLLRDS